MAIITEDIIRVDLLQGREFGLITIIKILDSTKD